MLNRKLLPGVPVILELKEIAKKYGTRTVLQSISFSIYVCSNYRKKIQFSDFLHHNLIIKNFYPKKTVAIIF